jgi:intracellular multiplication protein IcmK
VIRLSAGFITSLVFVDSTGAPWPIDSYSLGNPSAFNIQWDKKSNILLVQAITAHRMGNLAIILKGLNTPVMLDLNPGQAAMDVRVDLRIPGFGPQAKPAVDILPGTESPALLALLDGIPPQGARSLKSSACENCAWLVDKKLYLRTQFSVLSPAWISTLSSADGTHVYEMQLTPLVLATYNGKTIKMKIEGF